MTRLAELERDYYPGLEAELTNRRMDFHHQHDSRRSVAGWPDYTILAGPWLMFAELKAMGKSPTFDQWRWLQVLAGPWRGTAVVGVDALDELLRLVDAMKAGRLDGLAGLGAVLVLGSVKVPPGFDGGRLLGRGLQGAPSDSAPRSSAAPRHRPSNG